MTEAGVEPSGDTAVTDIAIIGGGLLGASAALLLSRALPGCSIALIEKNEFKAQIANSMTAPNFDARSTALSPTSIALMQKIGVWQELAAHATLIRSIQVSDKGHAGWVRLTEHDNQQQPLGAVVENQTLACVLIDAVNATPELTVLTQASVAHVQPRREHAQLRLVGGKSLCARLVIVADGADSGVAQQLGIGADVTDYQQHALVANVAYEHSHKGRAFERFTPQGPMALLPLGGTNSQTSALVWTWPSNRIEQALNMPESEFLRKLQHEFGYRLGRFTAVSKRSSFALRLSVAKEQVRSRVVLLGNAAHFLHPVAGQGYNLALRDALRLAEILAHVDRSEVGSLATLQRYQQQQQDDQTRTIRLSDGFNRVFGSQRPAVVMLRAMGMVAVESSHWVRSGFIRQMSGRASAQANPWR